MGGDGDRKRELLQDWWRELLPVYSVRLFGRGDLVDRAVGVASLGGLPSACRECPAVYILFADSTAGPVPVYVGKADDALTRWAQHLDGWTAGRGSYARWRRELLDEGGRCRDDLFLLIVPRAAITHPPIAGLPATVGAVEYQLVALAEDAYPGWLLNHEGRGR